MNWLTAQQDFLLQVYVVDAGTNEPLSFVNIQLEPGSQGGTTDERGKVSFRLPSARVTVRASFVGYEQIDRTILINRNINLDLLLVPAGENLSTVVVTDRDQRELIEKPVMGVERLSANDIASIPMILGEADVLRGLQLRSGVNSAGEASNGISVRGGTIDQNLTLLDGAPIFTPTHLFGLFSVFTPDALGSVDLYRSNVPARFGGRTASIIDVRSRVPSADNFRMQGGIGLVSSHLAIETPLTTNRKLKLLAAGRVGFNDFLFDLTRKLKNTESRFADGTLKLRYSPSTTSFFTLSGFASYDFYQIDLLNNFNNVTSSVNQYRYATVNGGLDWVKLIDDKTTWQTSLISSTYRPDLIFPEDGSDAEVTFSSQVRLFKFTSELSRQRGAHAFSGGIQAERYRIRPGELDPDGSESINATILPEEQGVEAALFLEDIWQVTDKLAVSAGLRYSRYAQLGPGEERRYRPGPEITPSQLEGAEEFSGSEVMESYGGFEPRLGINYQVGENNSIKAAWAVSRQYLQNIYNATTPLPTSRWKVSDAFIGPQRANLFSLGLYRVAKEGTYLLSVEGYFRKTDNILEYKPGADFFLEPLVETQLIQGTAEAWGLELTAEKTAGRLTGQANYTYARTFNRVAGPTFSTTINDGNRYAGYFDQPHTFNINLVLDKGRVHELGFNFVVQSNRPYTVPNGFLELNGLSVPLFLERNNARLPVYHRLDFSWTIHNFKREKRRWTGDWVVTIFNVYGRDNAFNIYFAPKDNSRPIALFSRSPLGSYKLSIFAAPVFSLGYKFKFE